MQAGYADIDITPQPGEELTGYGYFLDRRATGTLDPLLARALALSDEQCRAVIVQLDLLCLDKPFVMQVRNQAQERFALPPSHLLLHCTHTHSGPATRPLLGCGTPTPAFLSALREKLLGVIGEALDDLRPARGLYRFTRPFPDGFAYNRTGAGELDTNIRGLWIKFSGARPILVASYACHPVTLGVNRQYSADYPGAVIRQFNAYGVRMLYLNGCCGDVNPLSNAYKFGSGSPETLLIYGRDMARAIWQALREPQQWQPGPLGACSRMIPLQADMPSAQELRDRLRRLQPELQKAPDDGKLRVEVMWHQRMLELHERGSLAEAREAEVQAIACGDVVFVGLAAEAFTRLGGILRRNTPDHHLMIAATSNGVLGYIATREDIEGRGYASVDAARIYGMLPLQPTAGEAWAMEGGKVVTEAIYRSKANRPEAGGM